MSTSLFLLNGAATLPPCPACNSTLRRSQGDPDDPFIYCEGEGCEWRGVEAPKPGPVQERRIEYALRLIESCTQRAAVGSLETKAQMLREIVRHAQGALEPPAG